MATYAISFSPPKKSFSLTSRNWPPSSADTFMSMYSYLKAEMSWTTVKGAILEVGKGERTIKSINLARRSVPSVGGVR